MKKIALLATAAILGLTISANAAVVGEAGPFMDGSADGWSGITVMDGYGSIPAGDQVTTINYYANVDRADGNHHVQPLIVMNDGTTSSIWDVGPVMTPAVGGDHSGDWTSKVVPGDGNSYNLGFWQWNAGVNNDAGGVVPFNGAGGSGMFQEDEDGTSYVPAIGDEVVSGHASGVDGRAYQFQAVTATVPEPSTFALAALAALGASALVRRRK